MSRRTRRLVFAGVYAALTAFFSWVFYDRYYQWIDCFNDLGRCWVSEEGIVYTDSSVVWGLFAGVFFLLFVVSAARAWWAKA